jgi:A/G-specific adenine glycosylase
MQRAYADSLSDTVKRDPYSVVVSEVMLQQTQVNTVLKYYDNWMRLFPTFDALAKAPLEKVLKAWQGMGYYTRARNLKKLAQAVMKERHGELPRDVEDLDALPGIGKYSARSIASLAFDVPVACVDGNIVRVISRLLGIDKPFKSSSAAMPEFQENADQLLNQKHPALHNEAMMEFGALVCTKANPSCASCPMKGLCRGHALRIAEKLPRFEPRKTEEKIVRRAWIYDGDKILLQQSHPGRSAATGNLYGLWELPTLEALGVRRPGKELLRKHRGITKYKITEIIHRVGTGQAASGGKRLRWIGKRKLAQIPLSGPHGKWIRELLDH